MEDSISLRNRFKSILRDEFKKDIADNKTQELYILTKRYHDTFWKVPSIGPDNLMLTIEELRAEGFNIFNPHIYPAQTYILINYTEPFTIAKDFQSPIEDFELVSLLIPFGLLIVLYIMTTLILGI